MGAFFCTFKQLKDIAMTIKLTVAALIISSGLYAQKIPDRLQLAIRDSVVMQKTYNFSFSSNSYRKGLGWYRFTNSSASMKPGDVYISGDKFYYNNYTPAFMDVLRQPDLIVNNAATFDPQKLWPRP